MCRDYCTTQKQEFVMRYQKGETVAAICNETGIPQSTFYSWIKQHQIKGTDKGMVVTPWEFDRLRRKAEKLESMVSVLKTVNCTASSDLQEKLFELEQLYGQYNVHVLCESLDVPRGTFYNHIKRNKRSDTIFMQRREELREVIREAYDKSNQVFGANKIRAVLVEKGYSVSDKMVAELMREMGIYSIRTTSKRDYNRLSQYEKKTNVIQRNFRADVPNKVWVGDVTCFKFKEKFFYICAIIDLFSRRVIAYKISQQHSTHLIRATFKLAYEQRQPIGKLVFHSDRGTQYTSRSFRKLLRDYGIEQSFSQPGKPHDNAVAESFFASMKQEELYRGKYSSESEFKKGIDEYMIFYNTQRPHAAIRYKTPQKQEDDFNC